MNQMPKLTIPVLLLLALCTALSVASADSVAIKAEDGGDLPAIVSVGETFTVMITDGGSHVGAGTNVVFTLPASGGDPIYVPTDSDGKARYKPQTTGALKVKALNGTVTVAEATVTTAAYPAPSITDWSNDKTNDNSLAISDIEEATRRFNISVDQTVNVTWLINGTQVQTTENVTEDSYTNTSAVPGCWNISAVAENVNGTVMQTWIWDVAETNETNVTDRTEFTVTSGNASVTGSNFFGNNLTGWVNVTGITNVTASPDINVSDPYYGLGSDDQIVSGVIVNVSGGSNIESEMDEGNGTIRITICYDLAELGDIDPDTLAIWKYNSSTETWVAQTSTINGTCVYADVNHLCTFALVGSLKKLLGGDDSSGSGGGDGTYPPGWYETPTPVPTTTATAEATEPELSDESETTDESTTGAAEEAVTTGTDGEETPTTELATKGIPGFSAFLVIAGLLAAMYLVLRRRD